MARNKQRYQNQQRSGTVAAQEAATITPAAEAETETVLSTEAQSTEPTPVAPTESAQSVPADVTSAVETSHPNPDESTAVTRIEEEDEDIVLPEASETVTGQAAVDLEQEEIERNRAHAVAHLGFDKDAVLNRMSLTAKMSILGVIDYIARVEQYGPHMKVLLANESFVTDKGPEEQAKLFRNIMDIITKTDDASFQDGMNFLMLLFQEHGKEGAPLSAANLYRFQENIPLRAVELQLYPNLMRVLTTLCDPVTRSRDARAISFDKAFQYGLSEAARNRLMNYFLR